MAETRDQDWDLMAHKKKVTKERGISFLERVNERTDMNQTKGGQTKTTLMNL